MADKKERKRIHSITPKDFGSLFEGASEKTHEFMIRNFITFHAYESPILNYSATSTQEAITPGGELESYAFFYPRSSVREEISHEYAELEGVMASMLRLLKGAGKEAGKSIVLLENLFGKGKATITGGKPTTHAILDEEPTYFTRTNKRRFDITLDLYDLGNIQEDIYDPIRFFKKYSHATRASTLASDASEALPVGVGLSSFTYPSTFRITGNLFEGGYINPNSISRQHLLLHNMSVEYNPEGQMLNKSGLPIHARMTLTFEDAQSLFSNDWSGTSKFKQTIAEIGGDKDDSGDTISSVYGTDSGGFGGDGSPFK